MSWQLLLKYNFRIVTIFTVISVLLCGVIITKASTRQHKFHVPLDPARTLPNKSQQKMESCTDVVGCTENVVTQALTISPLVQNHIPTQASVIIKGAEEVSASDGKVAAMEKTSKSACASSGKAVFIPKGQYVDGVFTESFYFHIKHKIIIVNGHILDTSGRATVDGFICLPSVESTSLTGFKKLKKYVGHGLYLEDWGPTMSVGKIGSAYYAEHMEKIINHRVIAELKNSYVADWVQTDGILLNLDYDNVEIATVFNDMAKQAGMSIMFDSYFDASITMDVKSISLTDALNMITDYLGAVWVLKTGYIIITTPQSENYSFFSKEHVYNPSYLDAAQIVSMMPPYYQKFISSAKEINKIIISASEVVANKIVKLIGEIDKKPALIVLEALVVDIEQKSEAQLGIDWWNGNGFSYSDDDVQIGIFGSENGFENIIHNQQGINDAVGGIKGVENFQSTDITGLLPAVPFVSPLKMLSQSIKALSEKGLANVLATPRVVTSSGKVASINIQTEHVIPIHSGPKNFPQVIAKKFNTGVDLNIMPVLSQDGNIRLEIYNASVGTLLLTGHKQSGGTRLPVLTKREISTSISLSNRQVLAIGGLLDINSVEYQKRFPGLPAKVNTGVDVTNKRVRNLLILIRPTILKQGSQGNKAWKPIS